MRGLAIAGRWAAAARVADRTWEDRDDPAPTLICAILASRAGLNGATALAATAKARLELRVEGEVGYEDNLDRLLARLDAATDCNEQRPRSVSDFLIDAVDLEPGGETRRPAAIARAARAANPTAEMAMFVDLFFTGHPELALIDGRSGTAPSDVGLVAWWLASVQCGTIAEDADQWHDVDYATPAIINALTSEAEGMLGHAHPVEVVGVPADWLAAINARRAAGGSIVSGSWRNVALAQSAIAPSSRTQAAYRAARARLQGGDAAGAARELARAADEAPNRRSRAALLTAAAHASAMSDAELTYALAYADAAVASDDQYIPAACAALELAARVRSPDVFRRQQRLCVAIESSDTPETAEILRSAADAIAVASDDNAAGERFLAESTEAEPNSVVRWMALAEFRQRMGLFEGAIAALEEAARREPTRKFRAHAYERIAEIFRFDLGDDVPALESFLVSFVCWQGSASVLGQLEELYESLGRESELADTYRLAVEFTERRPAESEHDLMRLSDALLELQGTRA